MYKNINREKNNYEIRKSIIGNKIKSNFHEKSISRQSTLDSENPEEIFEAEKSNKNSIEKQSFFNDTMKKVVVGSSVVLGIVGAFIVGSKWFKK